MSSPDPNAEWWTPADVAAHLGVTPGTVHSYRSTGRLPEAEQRFGATPAWRPATVIEWDQQRPSSRRKALGSSTPDLVADWWGIRDVAAYTQVTPSTVSSRLHSGAMPQPDRRNGRSPLWKPATIVSWHRGGGI